MAFQGEGCVTGTVFGSPQETGVTGTVGVAKKVIGIFGGLNFYDQVTNATDLGQLKGLFTYATFSGGDIVGGSIVIFWNSNFSIYGVDFGGGLDEGVTASVGGELYISLQTQRP